MSDLNIMTAAARLGDLYREADQAAELAMKGRRAEEVAHNHISATLDSLTWLQPRTREESFIVAVLLGAKIFGNNVDEINDELLVTMNRMMRNLIRGMHKQFTIEQLASLPKWVLDDPVIARRVRIIEPFDDPAEAAA